MKKSFFWITCLLACSVITGCASQEQTAPCPNYGSSCLKKSINSWG